MTTLPPIPAGDEERLARALFENDCMLMDPDQPINWGRSSEDNPRGYKTEVMVWQSHARLALQFASLQGDEQKGVQRECPLSPLPSGKHQVDTSMESGPNNCFFCDQPMSALSPASDVTKDGE